MRKKVKLITEISKSAYDTIMARSVLTPNEAAKAIDAILNSIPLNESDDCVSRQEVCNIANDIKDYCVSMYNPNDASEAEIINYIYKYVNALYDLPSVIPKREQGEWCKQNDDYFDWYECSECGYGSEGEMQYSREHDVRTKYCPNCGAEMR